MSRKYQLLVICAVACFVFLAAVPLAFTTTVAGRPTMRLVPIDPPSGYDPYPGESKIFPDIETIVLQDQGTSYPVWFELRVSGWGQKLTAYEAYIYRDQTTADRLAGTFCPRPPCNCLTGSYSKSCSGGTSCPSGSSCVDGKCQEAYINNKTDTRYVFYSKTDDPAPSTSTAAARYSFRNSVIGSEKSDDDNEYVAGTLMISFAGGGCDTASVSRVDFDPYVDNIFKIKNASGATETIKPLLRGATIICDSDWKYP